MQLITDERLAAMFLRESSENAFTVLPDALDKVGRDPGIERALLAIGHHIDGNYAVLIGHAQHSFPNLPTQEQKLRHSRWPQAIWEPISVRCHKERHVLCRETRTPPHRTHPVAPFSDGPPDAARRG